MGSQDPKGLGGRICGRNADFSTGAKAASHQPLEQGMLKTTTRFSGRISGFDSTILLYARPLSKQELQSGNSTHDHDPAFGTPALSSFN